ncbi:MAG: integrase [Thiomonas sp. 14-66-4]|nr:MAG: integrase [Thiomonas sp. 14-66-4]
MAYIEKRKNGWCAQVRRRGMPSIARTFDLKLDAEVWAREIEREAQKGNIAALMDEAGKTTLADVIDRFCKDVVPTFKSAVNWYGYLRVAKARFGSYYLSSIRGADLARWLSELRAAGASAATSLHYLQAVSSCYSFAAKDLGIHLPAGNPARNVRKPKLNNARDRRVSADELAYLIRGIAGARKPDGMREYMILAVETSARESELLNLSWKRVDLDRRTAHLIVTKGDKPRTVALSARAVEVLRAMQSFPRRADGRVFRWTRPAWVSAFSRIRRRARELYEADCARDGVEPDPSFLHDLHFHDLRHEATSRLFEKGLGIMEVASMTGHKSLAMLKRYTHIDAERLALKLD